jgi:hypothetical protein
MLKVPTPLHPWGHSADSHLCNSSLTCWRYPHHFILGGTQLILICVIHHWHVEGTHTTSFLRALSWFSSELWTFMQFVIYEITFLTPKNSVLILHPPSIQHLSQPLLCSSFWNPWCAPVDLTGVSLPAKFASNKY